MRTLIFVLGFVLSTSLFAGFPKFQIQDFQGYYKNSSGYAKAEQFVIKNHDFGDKPEFSVEKQGSSIYFTTPKGEFSFNNLPIISDKLEVLRWQKINSTSDGNKLNITIPHLIAGFADQIFKANQFQLSCLSSTSIKENSLLDSCLNYSGDLSFKNIESISNNQSTSIKDFSLNIRNNKLRFRLRSSAKVKGEGEIRYIDNQIVIKITKAKAGAFSVRKRFFKELKQLESDKIQISRPYIKISL